MFVKPRAQIAVPDPERGGHLPPEGAAVPDTRYWRRRLADGDVVPAKAVATRAAKANPATAKE